MNHESANVLGAVLIATIAVSGCSTTPESSVDQAYQAAQVSETIERFKARDPALVAFFDKAHGYAVFPAITKGGAGVGGAHGRGQVFEQGRPVGHCDVTQATLGLQLGVQSFSEIIFFESKPSLDHLKAGGLAFAAQASAVAVESGSAASAKYEEGVAVFTMPVGGLMFETSIGGQRFRYVPR